MFLIAIQSKAYGKKKLHIFSVALYYQGFYF